MSCPEVIRIRATMFDGKMKPQIKNLCVDPQITSFEVLQNLLRRAFNIDSGFAISYLSKSKGEEHFLTMLSDWDVDAAFIGSSEPHLYLKVDLRPFDVAYDDWDMVEKNELKSRTLYMGTIDKKLFNSITEKLTYRVGKTVATVGKAIGFKNDEIKKMMPTKSPMTDSEFHTFLNGVGQLTQPHGFRLTVYQGGVETSLRKVVWRHLLNIFPDELTGRERFEYLQRKSTEYWTLRDEWKHILGSAKKHEPIRQICNMVRKDVLRTDRTHSYFAGSDENDHLVSLFNILVTYALTHPRISYCQGMSDIASPILYVQNDEAHSYICFCGLMRRLGANFFPDGVAITSKFQDLSLVIQHFDTSFSEYLVAKNADDLYFCYRWVLLELKREFPLDDALYMLEILWSSLPPDPPDGDLSLIEPMQSPESNDLEITCSNDFDNLTSEAAGVSPDQELFGVISTCGSQQSIDSNATDSEDHMRHMNFGGLCPNYEAAEEPLEKPTHTKDDHKYTPHGEESIAALSTDDEQAQCLGSMKEKCKLSKLPFPHHIGQGNPFLLFLCLSIFLQHRDNIMSQNMDYNEIAMYFHNLVRKHDVHEVVHQAKNLYGLYLKSCSNSNLKTSA